MDKQHALEVLGADTDLTNLTRDQAAKLMDSVQYTDNTGKVVTGSVPDKDQWMSVYDKSVRRFK
jgi:hypothetical protein